MGELGVAMDLHKKYSYRRKERAAAATSGDRRKKDRGGDTGMTGDGFVGQISALDSYLSSMEANLLSWTLWNYTPDNNNNFGDLWNGEDLSIFSLDQATPWDRMRLQSGFGEEAGAVPVFSGGRALEAVVRPYASKVAGKPLSSSFDLKTRTFLLSYDVEATEGGTPGFGQQPLEIFVPIFQYPHGVFVEVTRGDSFQTDIENSQTVRVWPSPKDSSALGANETGTTRHHVRITPAPCKGTKADCTAYQMGRTDPRLQTRAINCAALLVCAGLLGMLLSLAFWPKRETVGEAMARGGVDTERLRKEVEALEEAERRKAENEEARKKKD